MSGPSDASLQPAPTADSPAAAALPEAGPAVAGPAAPFRVSRRKMLLFSGATLAAGAGYYYGTRRHVNVGLIGAGVRGSGEALWMKWMSYGLDPYPKLLGICDVDLDKAKAVRDSIWPAAQVYQDYRELLANPDIQAVFVVTPDHWHTEMGIDAMRAGKAVYLEKPISMSLEEGFRLRDVAEQTGAVVEVGTQQRSLTPFQTAWELVRNGRLGQLKKIVISLDTMLPPKGLDVTPSAAPQSLDWNLWLGPAPTADYCQFRHEGWRCIAEYSGGMLTNWGSHQLDIALWVSGNPHSYPVAVNGTGTIPSLPLGTGVPTDFSVTFQYPSGPPIELRTTEKDHGVRFEGDRGRIFVNRRRVAGKPVEELASKPLPPDAQRVNSRRSPASKQSLADIQHFRDFFDCMLTGGTPLADLKSSVCVHSALHLANISIALGRPIDFNPETLEIQNDPEAAALASRVRRPQFPI